MQSPVAESAPQMHCWVIASISHIGSWAASCEPFQNGAPQHNRGMATGKKETVTWFNKVKE